MKVYPHPPDIEAEISFISTDLGGRKGPAFSGYRPQFYYDGENWAAVHEYPDAESVFPGQTTRGLLRFLSPESHLGRVQPGMDFEIREGAKVVAHGKVTKILNLEANAKTFLRATMRRALGAISLVEGAAASKRLCELLEKQAMWQNAKTILFYAPLPGEVDVWRLVVDSLKAGRTVVLPGFVEAEQAYAAFQIKDVDKDLRTGKFGVREPREGCVKIPLNRLDLAMVPGLAFDSDGRRLGRGKGFYDRLLAELAGPACGVAFDQQMVGRVPSGPHDIRLKYIVTPTRWLETSDRARP